MKKVNLLHECINFIYKFNKDRGGRWFDLINEKEKIDYRTG